MKTIKQRHAIIVTANQPKYKNMVKITKDKSRENPARTWYLANRQIESIVSSLPKLSSVQTEP